MRELRFTSEALDDLVDITAYVATSSGSRLLAEGVAAQIRAKCARLSVLPGTLGRSRSDLRAGLRSSSFKGYVIIFRYREHMFEVVAVLEGHRDIDTYLLEDDEG